MQAWSSLQQEFSDECGNIDYTELACALGKTRQEALLKLAAQLCTEEVEQKRQLKCITKNRRKHACNLAQMREESQQLQLSCKEAEEQICQLDSETDTLHKQRQAFAEEIHDIQMGIFEKAARDRKELEKTQEIFTRHKLIKYDQLQDLYCNILVLRAGHIAQAENLESLISKKPDILAKCKDDLKRKRKKLGEMQGVRDQVQLQEWSAKQKQMEQDKLHVQAKEQEVQEFNRELERIRCQKSKMDALVKAYTEEMFLTTDLSPEVAQMKRFFQSLHQPGKQQSVAVALSTDNVAAWRKASEIHKLHKDLADVYEQNYFLQLTLTELLLDNKLLKIALDADFPDASTTGISEFNEECVRPAVVPDNSRLSEDESCYRFRNPEIEINLPDQRVTRAVSAMSKPRNLGASLAKVTGAEENMPASNVMKCEEQTTVGQDAVKVAGSGGFLSPSEIVQQAAENYHGGTVNKCVEKTRSVSMKPPRAVKAKRQCDPDTSKQGPRKSIVSSKIHPMPKAASFLQSEPDVPLPGSIPNQLSHNESEDVVADKRLRTFRKTPQREPPPPPGKLFRKKPLVSCRCDVIGTGTSHRISCRCEPICSKEKVVCTDERSESFQEDSREIMPCKYKPESQEFLPCKYIPSSTIAIKLPADQDPIEIKKCSCKDRSSSQKQQRKSDPRPVFSQNADRKSAQASTRGTGNPIAAQSSRSTSVYKPLNLNENSPRTGNSSLFLPHWFDTPDPCTVKKQPTEAPQKASLRKQRFWPDNKPPPAEISKKEQSDGYYWNEEESPPREVPSAQTATKKPFKPFVDTNWVEEQPAEDSFQDQPKPFKNQHSRKQEDWDRTSVLPCDPPCDSVDCSRGCQARMKDSYRSDPGRISHQKTQAQRKLVAAQQEYWVKKARQILTTSLQQEYLECPAMYATTMEALAKEMDRSGSSNSSRASSSKNPGKNINIR